MGNLTSLNFRHSETRRIVPQWVADGSGAYDFDAVFLDDVIAVPVPGEIDSDSVLDCNFQEGRPELLRDRPRVVWFVGRINEQRMVAKHDHPFGTFGSA